MTVGIYIQVPFCQTKCTYCNFHTGVESGERYAPYAEAVCREIALWSAGLESRETAVDTVYFGGGTPSLLDPAALARILASLGPHLLSVRAPEITLEADPETVTTKKARAWLAAGFSRVSLGAQSFDDRELRSAGRMHRCVDTYRATELLRDAGFRNISLDLIAGLPHQTRQSWENSLRALVGIRPEHISIYVLEIDEGSRLGRESLAGGSRYGACEIPSDDAMAEFYECACSGLAQAGYEHYEISNWALPGRRSQHNLKYWRREPYVGFGAGAHSFDGRTRSSNIHDWSRYVVCMQQGISPLEQLETVTLGQALEEEFFLGLRQLEGIDLARIERDYGADLRGRLQSLRRRIAGLRTDGLVELEGRRLRLAPSRLTVSNEVFVELLG